MICLPYHVVWFVAEQDPTLTGRDSTKRKRAAVWKETLDLVEIPRNIARLKFAGKKHWTTLNEDDNWLVFNILQGILQLGWGFS